MKDTQTFEDKNLMKIGRSLVINGDITDSLCAAACLALLELEAENPDEDITILINSSGGSVRAGFMLIDTMKVIKPDVETICMGLAASMAAMVLMAGEPGKRKALPHCRIMLHQPLCGANYMQVSDFEIMTRELAKGKKDIYDFICASTGKSFAQVEECCDRDFWMDVNEAMAFGIVDKVVTKEER